MIQCQRNGWNKMFSGCVSGSQLSRWKCWLWSGCTQKHIPAVRAEELSVTDLDDHLTSHSLF